jgi:Tfp pilus assembly protein PilV
MTDTRKQTRLCPADSGFTLIEVTVSLTVLMIFLVCLSGLTVTASRLLESMEQRYPENTPLYFNSNSSPWERNLGVSAILSSNAEDVVTDTNVLVRTIQMVSFSHDRNAGEISMDVTATEPPP